MRAAARAVGLLLALLVAACGGETAGGSGGGTGTGPGPAGGGGSQASTGSESGAPARLDPATLCADVIALQCQGHLSCCRNEDDRYASAEECRSLLEPLCVQDLSGGAYASGRIAFDREAYVRALAQLRQAVEQCQPIGRQIWREVFQGTLGEGDDCTPDVEQGDYSHLLACGRELACVVRGGGDAPTRECAPRAAEGEPCLDVDCAEGLHCAGSGDRPVCRPLRAEGIGCAAHTECATSYCDDDGRCAPLSVAYRYCEDLTYP